MLMAHRLLTRIPMTLDLGAWYAGSTSTVVVLVMVLAFWAVRAATIGGRSPRRLARNGR